MIHIQELFQKKFHPCTDTFTQALLVMLVKNITSKQAIIIIIIIIIIICVR